MKKQTIIILLSIVSVHICAQQDADGRLYVAYGVYGLRIYELR